MPWDEYNKIEWGGDPTQKKAKRRMLFFPSRYVGWKIYDLIPRSM